MGALIGVVLGMEGVVAIACVALGWAACKHRIWPGAPLIVALAAGLLGVWRGATIEPARLTAAQLNLPREAVVVSAPAPAPPPGPLKPASAPSNATMAITLDDTPVVGWLVPINGPQQFKTFKLFAGVTKVGNAAGAHIFIDDGYMSGEHAHVAMSPSGFTLIDNGSTNGTYVNERRVQRHELIDNDVIKFGKTDCKFKTINTDA